MIPQLYTECELHEIESFGQFRVTCSVHSSLQVGPLACVNSCSGMQDLDSDLGLHRSNSKQESSYIPMHKSDYKHWALSFLEAATAKICCQVQKVQSLRLSWKVKSLKRIGCGLALEFCLHTKVETFIHAHRYFYSSFWGKKPETLLRNKSGSTPERWNFLIDRHQTPG